MYKVLVLFDVEGWAYHRTACALRKHAPEGFHVDIANEKRFNATGYDLVMCMSFHMAPKLRKRIPRGVLLVSSYNFGYPCRESYDAAARAADYMVLNNHLNWEAFDRPAHSSVIPNGVDTDIFQSRVPNLDDRPVQVLWTGSVFHRGIKNYDKIVVPLSDKLATAGISHEFHLVDSQRPRFTTPRAMAEWYNTGMVYLVASEAEGTPNTALEAAACGCVLVTTPVGNMPRLTEHGVNGLLCERTVEAFYDGILAALPIKQRLSENMLRSIESWSWRVRSAEYFQMFSSLLEGSVP